MCRTFKSKFLGYFFYILRCIMEVRFNLRYWKESVVNNLATPARIKNHNDHCLMGFQFLNHLCCHRVSVHAVSIHEDALKTRSGF